MGSNDELMPQQSNYYPQPYPQGATPTFNVAQQKGALAGYSEWISNLNSEFGRLQHTLGGEIEVKEKLGEETVTRWEKRFKPLMNEEGIFRIGSFLRDSIVNKNVFFSTTSADKAAKACLMNSNDIKEFLYLQRHHFEIHENDYRYICRLCKNLIEFSIQRAVNAHTLDVTSGTVQQLYQSQEINDSQKQGGNIFGIKSPWS